MSTESSSESVHGKELMRRLPLLEGLAEDDLEQLYEMSSIVTVPAGTLLMREGEPGDTLYIIVDGELEILKGEGSAEQVIANRRAGEVVGEMAVLERAPRFASARTLRDSRLLVIDQAAFATLLSCSSTATLTILNTVVSRLRNTESMLVHQEKLAALGTMAAGLAHELNNPAAAITRSSSQLRDGLATWERSVTEVANLELNDRLAELRTELSRRAAQPPRLDALSRSEQEDALQAWLEAGGLEPAWELAPVLVAAGWSREALEAVAASFTAEQVPAVVRWLAAGAGLFALLEDTRTSAAAISGIVKAVKSYAYLDQAPVQEIDVHEGLENTLTILKHKMSGGITLKRDYARDLPRIEAYGGELNQAWTNIIDNAIDAMQGQGELTVRTHARRHQVVVEFRDNGPGIPPEIQPRIFEPFFTTKAQGSGTGLGLHIAYNIVVHRHQGQLRVTSEPGFTCFQASLPITLPQRQADAPRSR